MLFIYDIKPFDFRMKIVWNERFIVNKVSCILHFKRTSTRESVLIIILKFRISFSCIYSKDNNCMVTSTSPARLTLKGIVHKRNHFENLTNYFQFLMDKVMQIWSLKSSLEKLRFAQKNVCSSWICEQTKSLMSFE